MAKTFLTAEWRKLVMAQYEVDPAVLAPWLPHGVELDLYRDGSQSRCYVSLVGFLFDRVRLKGVAIPFHTRFEEVNLRFYVVRIDPTGVRRRGVVFIREFVPRAAITLVARSVYQEPYATLPTRCSLAATPQSLSVGYSWKHQRQWHSLSVDASPTPQEILPGSHEEFITEHYWGFTQRRDGSTSQFEVKHPRWQVYPIHSVHVAADFDSLYGPAFADLTARAPDHVLLAEGSPVEVESGAAQRLA